jgi:hypothetical protein
LAGFEYWSAWKKRALSVFIISATTRMAPSEPSSRSEKVSSAPNARAMSLRACDTFAGMTRRMGTPSAAPYIA